MEERQQISVGTLAGNKVVIQLHKQALDMLELQGVDSERLVAKVAGADNFGLWIENPNYCTVPVYDDDGNYIPPEARKQVCDRAVILIMWGNIQTIIQFPDRPGYQAGEQESEIGFLARHWMSGVKSPATPVGGGLAPPRSQAKGLAESESGQPAADRRAGARPAPTGQNASVGKDAASQAPRYKKQGGKGG